MYTDRISLDLAKELESKGFIPDIGADDWDIIAAEWKTAEACFDTYADVFDWLYEKGIYIMISQKEDTNEWLYLLGFYGVYKYGGETWNEAADTAIRMALKIINDK